MPYKISKRNTPVHEGLKDSFYEAHFHDSTVFHEHEYSWKDLSEEKTVKYFGEEKQVRVSKGVSKMIVSHNGLVVTLNVPKDCEVYQAVRSETIFFSNGQKKDLVLGRCLGLVKDGEVIEERFINSLENQIFGVKK